MLLSICIPSYNRGKRAHELVTSLLPLLNKHKDELEIIVSNNGSTVGVEYYAQIKEMADSLEGIVTYHRFEKNQFYVGNFRKILELSRGDFCLIISDEDCLLEEGLEYYIKLLSELRDNSSDIAIVRAMTSKFYKGMKAGHFAAGPCAVEQYFMLGNYISGIIYNRRYLTDMVIDDLWCKYYREFDHEVALDDISMIEDNGSAFFYYPHMFVDGMLLAQNDLLVDSNILVIEGEDAKDTAVVNDTELKIYATYEQRLNQFAGFMNFINDLGCDDATTLSLVKNAIISTVLLINNVRQAYLALSVNWADILDIEKEAFNHFLCGSKKPVISGNTAQFMEWVNQLIEPNQNKAYSFLFYRYNNICEADIIDAIKSLGHAVDVVDLEMTVKNPSGKQIFEAVVPRIQNGTYDAVFSVNFYPVLSKICQALSIRYISWTTDCPVDELFSSEITNSVNRTFCFDYAQYERAHELSPSTVFYMPLAANVGRWDRTISNASDEDRSRWKSDISFVGSLYTEKVGQDWFAPSARDRQEAIDAILEAVGELTDEHITENVLFRLFTGSDTGYLEDKDIDCCGTVKTHTQMPIIFNQSKINLNVTCASITTGIPQRIWDVLGCKGFLITNHQAEIDEFLVSGKDLVVYEDLKDLKEKIKYYLVHEDEREEIAANGYAKVKAEHTFESRLADILYIAFYE